MWNNQPSQYSFLTFPSQNDIVWNHGEMSERFKELVLKTSDAATHRGFESHSLRQKADILTGYLLFLLRRGLQKVNATRMLPFTIG